jgi:hypothetical protein
VPSVGGAAPCVHGRVERAASGDRIPRGSRQGPIDRHPVELHAQPPAVRGPAARMISPSAGYSAARSCVATTSSPRCRDSRWPQVMSPIVIGPIRPERSVAPDRRSPRMSTAPDGKRNSISVPGSPTWRRPSEPARPRSLGAFSSMSNRRPVRLDVRSCGSCYERDRGSGPGVHDPVRTNIEFDECPGYGVYAALSGSPMQSRHGWRIQGSAAHITVSCRKLLISCEDYADGNGQTPPNVIKVWRENVDAYR